MYIYSYFHHTFLFMFRNIYVREGATSALRKLLSCTTAVALEEIRKKNVIPI